MNRTLYNLTAGVYTPIPALQFARLVKMWEDGTGNGVGLSVKFADDNFTVAYAYPPAIQPVVIGNEVAQGRGQGAIQGWPVQTGLNARAADNYAKVSCLSGTTVMVVEEED